MTEILVKASRGVTNNAIQILTIDRPPRNAMSMDTYRQLLQHLEDGSADPSVRCVILTGAGDSAFVAGGELSEHVQLTPQTAGERTALVRKVNQAIRQHRAPVIAAVNGYALGGGLVLMASCDIVFASTNAKFSLPEVKVGVLGGTRHLRRLVPDKVVRYMALTGNLVDAAYFKQIGVIQDVVPLDDLMNIALKTAEGICAHSAVAIKLMKETLNLTEHMELDEGYHVECLATSILKGTPEAQEAAMAALQKRKPDFSQWQSSPA